LQQISVKLITLECISDSDMSIVTLHCRYLMMQTVQLSCCLVLIDNCTVPVTHSPGAAAPALQSWWGQRARRTS